MKKLAILTNLIAPSRVPIYLELSKSFETVVAIGKPESNRSEWVGLDRCLEEGGVRVVVSAGRTFRLSESRFFQINPGHFRFLLREKPDAIVTIELGFRTMVAYLYSRIARRPLWIWWAGTPHSERRRLGVRRRIRRYFASQDVRWITYGSESSRYLASIGVPRERILQVQNSVDESRFTPEGNRVEEGTEGPILLVVGQLIERKGLEPLLRAVHRLQQSGATFTLRFVGSGPRREGLERLSRDLGLQNVEFLGGVSPAELPAHYRTANALIFPTLEDVWGLVANEALLCGTPVICSRYAGCASELLDDEDIFDPLDDADFDRALRRAVDGEACPPVPERIWPISRVTKTLRDDIERVLESQSR